MSIRGAASSLIAPRGQGRHNMVMRLKGCFLRRNKRVDRKPLDVSFSTVGRRQDELLSS